MNWIQKVLNDSTDSPSSKRVIAFLSFANFLVLINYSVITGVDVNMEYLIMLLSVVGAGIFGATFEMKKKDANS